MNVIVIVAHADDEALGAGGTIAKLSAAGHIVSVVIVSSGIVTLRGSEQDNRAAARQSCEVLGAQPPVFLGFDDQVFDTVPLSNIIDGIYSLDLVPDLIFTHAETDLNSDHRLVCEAVKAFSRPRGGRVISILGCEVPSSTFWNGMSFPANYYVDVGETIETKIEAFACYKNELREYPDPWSREGLRLLAQYHGMQSGLPAAEAFTVIRGYESIIV